MAARRVASILLVLAAVVLALFAPAAEARALKQFPIITPTPFQPFVGPTLTTVRPTPFNPFVGPVVTSSNVRTTPFNPFIGPVVTTRRTVIGH